VAVGFANRHSGSLISLTAIFLMLNAWDGDPGGEASLDMSVLEMRRQQSRRKSIKKGRTDATMCKLSVLSILNIKALIDLLFKDFYPLRFLCTRSYCNLSPIRLTVPEPVQIKSRGKRTLKANRGVALVEFALIIAIAFPFMAMLFDSGRTIWGYWELTTLTREAARYAMMQSPRDDAFGSPEGFKAITDQVDDYLKTKLANESWILKSYAAAISVGVHWPETGDGDDGHFDTEPTAVINNGDTLTVDLTLALNGASGFPTTLLSGNTYLASSVSYPQLNVEPGLEGTEQCADGLGSLCGR